MRNVVADLQSVTENKRPHAYKVQTQYLACHSKYEYTEQM